MTSTIAAPYADSGASTIAAARLISLDVSRGLTVAAMVIVNNPGDWGQVYWPLLHAQWNGWTPTDLIFPFFLFIVGVSITLSRKSTSWRAILRRSVVIIALGLFVAGFPRFDVTRWRIPGVLQRIGVCYLCAASLYRLTAGTSRRQASILASVAALLTAAYCFVMMRVPNPFGAIGDLSPEGNWGAYIDRAVFGSHLWASSKTWDPEGLLSTVPAIATTVIGVVAGLILRSAAPASRKAARLAMMGLLLMAIGYAWHPFFPINKSLWTSSYVFFTAGAASVLLSACYWLIDVRGVRGWTHPFEVFGSNAITLFVVSGLLAKTLGLIQVGWDGAPMPLSRWIYVHAFAPIASPKNASLLYAAANLVVLYALLAWMYRRRIFLRV